MLLNEIFESKLTEKKFRFLFLYFSIISILEVLAFSQKGLFEQAAVKIWIVTGVVCLIIILTNIGKALFLDMRDKKFHSIAGILALTVFLLYLIGNINLSDINPDAAQQAAAGLEEFKSGNLNYTGKAFLGYPGRQYLIAALPALFLGRSIVTLHLGFGLPFILGLHLLYSALRKWAQKRETDTSLAVLPCYAIFVFPFITEYYTNFEQAIYPVAFTMLAAGFFLLVLCEPTVFNITGLAWVGCLLVNSYTPALASLGLLLVLMALTIYWLLTKPEQLPFTVKSPRLIARVMLLASMNMMVYLLATFLGKRQDRVTELRGDVNLVKLAGTSIFEYLTDKNAVFFGMLGIVVLVYLAAGLALRLKVRDCLIALWVFGVFATSYLLPGYTSYDPAWMMQRSMLVIPVLVVGITITVFDYMSLHNVKLRWELQIILLLCFALIGFVNFNRINQSFLYFNNIQPMKYLWQNLENTVQKEELEDTSSFNLVLYTDNILMKNPGDYCKFFYPNALVYTPDTGTFPSELDTELPTIIYGESDFSAVVSDTIGQVSTTSDQAECKSFQDRKHHLEVTWYKEVIAGE